MTDDRIDTLIDEVAKEMTTAPGAGDFASRVSARIAERRERRTPWTWILVPAAAAMVVVALAVNVRLKPDTTKDATTVAAKADTTYAALQPIVPIADATPPVISPIEIDTLDVQPLVEMDQIQIREIAIDRIDISPMP